MDIKLAQILEKITTTNTRCYTRFDFGYPAQSNRFDELASALSETNSELRRMFIVRLVELWNPKGNHSCMTDTDEWKELLDVFGSAVHDVSGFVGLRLIFTVAHAHNHETELRCWYGWPARCSNDHVDGADSGMLFSLIASYAEVRAILDEVQECRFKDKNNNNFIELKNGVRIYGFFTF